MNRHIPSGSITIRAKAAPAVVYVYERDGAMLASGYYGRAKKPSFSHRFGSAEHRARWVSQWIERSTARAEDAERKKTERREKLAAPHGLQVGDVLSASWGYEQTNIDYYEVVALRGARTAEIRKIRARTEEAASMQGQSVPVPGSYCGDAMRRRIGGDGDIRINDHVWATRLRPIGIVDGVRIYPPQHWTAYA